jgi:hypothetical protein
MELKIDQTDQDTGQVVKELIIQMSTHLKNRMMFLQETCGMDGYSIKDLIFLSLCNTHKTQILSLDHLIRVKHTEAERPMAL